MKNHPFNIVYFSFDKPGEHNMPVQRTLKVVFNDWGAYTAFLSSDFLKQEKVNILASCGTDGPDLPTEWKAKLEKAVPDIHNALLVRIKHLLNGINLEIVNPQ
ncbi:hypothetical protein [Chitinophaga japonensis]|uniref:Uncharacterized protein n=1 Tax=Chitinophaga japonensis TaxID=104662 RepID=A0A562T8W1_CHIJA|nr:hypothetical protein [Chitinophaga japonensis]TWI89260.1 hypothetical protein LX66_3355 [Chitinophaga japonensis]